MLALVEILWYTMHRTGQPSPFIECIALSVDDTHGNQLEDDVTLRNLGRVIFLSELDDRNLGRRVDFRGVPIGLVL
jgi:hypothetical protein